MEIEQENPEDPAGADAMLAANLAEIQIQAQPQIEFDDVNHLPPNAEAGNVQAQVNDMNQMEQEQMQMQIDLPDALPTTSVVQQDALDEHGKRFKFVFK